MEIVVEGFDLSHHRIDIIYDLEEAELSAGDVPATEHRFAQETIPLLPVDLAGKVDQHDRRVQPVDRVADPRDRMIGDIGGREAVCRRLIAPHPIGRPGSGKSQLGLDLLVQVSRRGLRFIFFDLKGELEDDAQNPHQRRNREQFLELTQAKTVRLIRETLPINPLVREDLPDTAQEIIERVNEISFNTALLHELRAIAFVERLLAQQKLDPGLYKRVNMHMIEAEEQLRKYGASSKTYTSPGFLKELFELGRRTALDWLDRNFAYVGHVSSVRITERFL